MFPIRGRKLPPIGCAHHLRSYVPHTGTEITKSSFNMPYFAKCSPCGDGNYAKVFPADLINLHVPHMGTEIT